MNDFDTDPEGNSLFREVYRVRADIAGICERLDAIADKQDYLLKAIQVEASRQHRTKNRVVKLERLVWTTIALLIGSMGASVPGLMALVK